MSRACILTERDEAANNGGQWKRPGRSHLLRATRSPESYVSSVRRTFISVNIRRPIDIVLPLLVQLVIATEINFHLLWNRWSKKVL